MTRSDHHVDRLYTIGTEPRQHFESRPVTQPTLQQIAPHRRLTMFWHHESNPARSELDDHAARFEMRGSKSRSAAGHRFQFGTAGEPLAAREFSPRVPGRDG
jgi:hypothetical protein